MKRFLICGKCFFGLEVTGCIARCLHHQAIPWSAQAPTLAVHGAAFQV